MRFNRLHEATNYIVPTDYTQTLSRFVEGLSWENIPKEAVAKAKQMVIQAVGAAVMAGEMRLSAQAEEAALGANGGQGGPCISWGTGNPMSAANAAFASAARADITGWGDCSDRGHFASCMVPAAWAAAEEKGKSGKELLTALVAAYEANVRIADAVQPDEAHRANGWGAASWPIFGVILAVGRLYGLDVRELDQAIGLGCECSTIPGNYSCETGSEFLHFEYASRARDGILIVKSVEKGINNCRDTLDEASCYSCAMTDDWRPELYTKGLGQEYRIEAALMKKWPACAKAQGALDALYTLMEEEHIRTESIEKIHICLNGASAQELPPEGPKTTVQESLSIPCMVANLLCTPKVSQWYGGKDENSGEVRSMAERIQMTVQMEIAPVYMDAVTGEEKGSISILLTDGRSYEKIWDGWTEPTLEESILLFKMWTKEAVSEGYAEKAAEALLRIEEWENVADYDWILSGLRALQIE